MNPKRLGRNLVFALSIVVVLAMTGCSKSAPVIHAGPPPTGPTMLKLNKSVGSSIALTVNLNQPMETQIPGQPEPMKQNLLLTQKFNCSVLSESADGGSVIEVEIVGTKVSMKGGMQGGIDFDSSDSAADKTPTGAAARRLVGAKVKVYLDASNEVQKVEGADELKKLIGPMAKNDPSGMLTDLTSEDTFRNLMKGSEALPPTPVQPGDTWPVHRETHSRALGIMVADYTYTFKGWERRDDHNVAHLEYAGNLTTQPVQDLRISGMPATVQGGKSSGEAWFDLEEGMFVDGNLQQDMTVTLKLPKTAGMMAGQPITISLNQDITVKAVRTR